MRKNKEARGGALLKFYSHTVKYRKTVFAAFAVMFVLCLAFWQLVSVNYDVNDYLPPETQSMISIEKMEEEFGGGIPNARVMVRGVSVPEALEYKSRLAAIDGVESVTWLDDAVDITAPMATLDASTVETYYKDENALFSVTVREDAYISATAEIRGLIGEDNAATGIAVSISDATTNTVKEIYKIAAFAVLFALFVLILTTRSWIDPLLILGGLGVAIVINSGTNIIFGEISFVTNAAGSILQLAVSLDYSVFLIHRFEECRTRQSDPEAAMAEALSLSTSSILSSGLTTVIGFLALVLMRFGIGPDLGLALAKGVAISLVTVLFFMPALTLAFVKLTDKTRHRALLPDFHSFGRFVRKASIPLVIVFLIAIAPAYLASNANSYYFGSSHIFGENTRLGADTAAIDEAFGESDTIALLVPRGDTANESSLSADLHAIPHITSIISYVDTVGAQIPTSYLDGGTLSQLESDGYSRMILTTDLPIESDETFRLVERVRETAAAHYGDGYYLAGQGVGTYDLMDTITSDMIKVNLIAIVAVFAVLLVTLRSVTLPFILVISIETAIWLNLSAPYFMDHRIYYIAYLIISTIQLGSTVDYAILLTERYRENRQTLDKRRAAEKTVGDVAVSILTSGSVLTVVGFLLGYISSNMLLAQLGIFIGRGALFSLGIVLFVLPGLLMLFDRLTRRGTPDHKITSEADETNMKKSDEKAPRAALYKRIAAAVLAVVMTALLGTPAFAADAAADTPTPKEEVVYVSLNDDGSVREINVVNIFELDKAGGIVDYGDYESVRNMTTTDGVDYENGKIKIDASAGRLYYEGKLKNAEMPWNISIRYYLDGREYKGSEIAGLDGSFKMTVDITENESYTKHGGGFFDGYALLASLTLDTDKCRDIKADGATAANVGGDKQLSYTILPGHGANIVITAEVTDFEAVGLSVNGVPLSLGIEIDDGAVTDKLSELADSAVKLDDGAAALGDGIDEIKAGFDELQSGADALEAGISKLSGGADAVADGSADAAAGAEAVRDGASALSGGIDELSAGIDKVKIALDEINANSPELVNGSEAIADALHRLSAGIDDMTAADGDLGRLGEASRQISSGIDELMAGAAALRDAANYNAYKKVMLDNGLDLDYVSTMNSLASVVLGGKITTAENGIAALEQEIAAAKANGEDTAALEAQSAQLKGELSQYTQIKQLIDASTANITGIRQYLNALGESAGALYDGISALDGGFAEYDSGVDTLAGAVSGLPSAMASLKDAIGMLSEEYAKLEAGIKTYTDSVAQVAEGYGAVSAGAAELSKSGEALSDGAGNLCDGIGAVSDGIDELSSGIAAIKGGSGELSGGIGRLSDGVDELSDGVKALADGTRALRGGTEGMDEKVSDAIDAMISSVVGKGVETGSFVSEKNTNVKSVQFVIKADGIAAPEPPAAPASSSERLTFWQKLLRLFGLY